MCCPPDMVGALWPHVETYMEAATTRAGDLELSAIENMVFGGNALLWVITDGVGIVGAFVTQLLEIRGARVCQVVAIGGDGLEQWKHLITEIETFAKNEECQKVRLSGRKGWERVFPDYAHAFVTLEKVLR